jgi:hypothetical protein
LDCLSAEIGARSKRNFHRPESNWWVAIHSAREAFIVAGDFSLVRSATGRIRLATASLSIGKRGEFGLHVV